jgi:hypothetical protein
VCHSLLQLNINVLNLLLVAFLTQAMYAYRIRTLGKLKCIPWCIMAVRRFEIILRSPSYFLLIQMIISELITIFAVLTVLPTGLGILVSDLTYATLVQLLQGNFQAWASISLVIDVMVAGAMIWSVRD